MDGIRHDSDGVRHRPPDNFQSNEYGGNEDDSHQFAVVLGRILRSWWLIQLMDIPLLPLFHLNYIVNFISHEPNKEPNNLL